MGLFSRIAKKIARRFRTKGVVRKQVYRPGRNHHPIDAVDLWRRAYNFKEVKAARAGTKRRMQRERRAR